MSDTAIVLTLTTLVFLAGVRWALGLIGKAWDAFFGLFR